MVVPFIYRESTLGIRPTPEDYGMRDASLDFLELQRVASEGQ